MTDGRSNTSGRRVVLQCVNRQGELSLGISKADHTVLLEHFKQVSQFKMNIEGSQRTPEGCWGGRGAVAPRVWVDG